MIASAFTPAELGALTLFTAPGEYPVTKAMARMYVKAATDVEDALLIKAIAAGTSEAEAELGRALITQTWELALDAFPSSREIRVPKPPLVSVASLKYLDWAGVEQTWGAGNYHVDTRREPGRIVLKEGVDWPETAPQPNAVVVRFTCGYGGMAKVPQQIQLAICCYIQAHDGRDPTQTEKLRASAAAYLFPFKVFG